MKRPLKTLAALAIVACSAITAKAQLSIGPQVGLANHLTAGISQMAFGIKGEFAKDDKIALGGSINYYIPKTYATETEVNSFSNITYPSSLTLNSKTKFGGFNINAEAKRYTFGAEFEDNVAPYFIVGVGLNLFTVKDEITDQYSQADYSPNPGVGQPQSYVGFSINGGLGVDINLNDNFLFFEAKALIPANQANGEYIEVEIPLTVALTAGYRISF